MVTHIFTPDCLYLYQDAVSGVKEGLIASFVLVDDAARADEASLANPFWEVEWDFVLLRNHAIP